MQLIKIKLLYICLETQNLKKTETFFQTLFFFIEKRQISGNDQRNNLWFIRRVFDI